MRAGKAQIAEAYVYLKSGEAYLFGAHINALNSASTHVDTDPTRTRKLLLNRASSITWSARWSGAAIPSCRWSCIGRQAAPSSKSGSPKAKNSTNKRANEKDRDWQRDKGRIMKAARR